MLRFRSWTLYFSRFLTESLQSAGALEYIDTISAEGQYSPATTRILDKTKNFDDKAPELKH